MPPVGAGLTGIDLVIFDKDGTLIDFHAMWSGWAEELADRLEGATGQPLREPLFAMLGYDPVGRRTVPGGALSATPMARLREATGVLLQGLGMRESVVLAALDAAWHGPDPVATAHPLADLHGLFGALHRTGRRVAVVTSDDREPTVRTIAALGLADEVDAVVCADDGVPTKPAPDAVHLVCAGLGMDPGRAAVVGDSPADLAMGRRAGAGLVIAVRTGVGTTAELADADIIVESVEALRPVD